MRACHRSDSGSLNFISWSFLCLESRSCWPCPRWCSWARLLSKSLPNCQFSWRVSVCKIANAFAVRIVTVTQEQERLCHVTDCWCTECWPSGFQHQRIRRMTCLIEGLPPMPPTPNRGDSKVGCGRSKQCLGDGRQVSGILQPFCVDAQPSGSIPTSQQQTDGQSSS